MNLNRHRTKSQCPTDRPHPKRRLSHLHGPHSRRPDIPPGPRHGESRVHARDESHLGHQPRCPGFRAEIPARVYLGAVLQLRGVCDRDVD